LVKKFKNYSPIGRILSNYQGNFDFIFANPLSTKWNYFSLPNEKKSCIISQNHTGMSKETDIKSYSINSPYPGY